jgi:hypothetical protein
MVYLLVFHAYIKEMHGSRSKIPSKKSRPYIYDDKFLAVLGAPYIYNILSLRDNKQEKKKECSEGGLCHNRDFVCVSVTST